MRITIRHQMSVAIGSGYARAIQHLLLTPQSSGVQTVIEWELDAAGMDGATGFIDAFGNRAHLSSQTRPEETLVVAASGVIDTIDRHGVVGRLPSDPMPALFRRQTELTRPIAELVDPLRDVPRTGGDRIALLHQLMAAVPEALQAQSLQKSAQSQAQSQSLDGQSQHQDGQVQTKGSGDSEAPDAAALTHAYIGAARALDIPARYVTGWFLPEDKPGTFHCWAEAWDDGLGWIGFDCTLNECPAERHIRLATGLDAESAAPIRAYPSLGPATVTEITLGAG